MSQLGSPSAPTASMYQAKATHPVAPRRTQTPYNTPEDAREHMTCLPRIIREYLDPNYLRDFSGEHPEVLTKLHEILATTARHLEADLNEVYGTASGGNASI
jgi:hypothetical protein